MTVNLTEKVSMHYFGHSAFMWRSPKGYRILIDPYGNPTGPRWFHRPFPSVRCDIVLVTHPHFDHDAVDRVQGRPTFLRHPLELCGDDFRIRGIMGKHAKDFGQEFGQQNLIFIVQTAGITFCHLGDNRADLSEATLNALGEVDVLMVSVDESQHLLTYAEVDQIVACLKPAIVIPMHYWIKGLTASTSSLGGIENWLAKIPNVRRIKTMGFEFTYKDLPSQREVWAFVGNASAIFE